MKQRPCCFHLTPTIQYNLLSVSHKSQSVCYQGFIHVELSWPLQIVRNAKLKTINRKIQLYCDMALLLQHHRSNTCLTIMENRLWGYLCLGLHIRNNFATEVSLLNSILKCRRARMTIAIMNFSWWEIWIRLKMWAIFQNFHMTGSWDLARLLQTLKRLIVSSNI